MSSFATAQTEQRGPGFDATPLQSANLAFYSLFAIAGLCQLSIAATFLFRTGSPHYPPGVGGVAAQIVLVLANGINVAATIANYTYDDFHNPAFSAKTILVFEVVGILFNDWLDPTILLLISLVLRDRYLTRGNSRRNVSFRTFLFTVVVLFFTLVLFIVVTMSTSIYNTEYTLLLDGSIDEEQFQKKYPLVIRLHQAFVGLYIAFTFLLSIFGFMLRKNHSRDKITIITVSIIIPLLCLHAIARLIFEVLNYTLPLKSSFTTHTADALDFSSTIVFHTLFFVLTCVLSYFFLNAEFWDISGRPSSLHQNDYPLQLRTNDGSSTHLAPPLNYLSRPLQDISDDTTISSQELREGIQQSPEYILSADPVSAVSTHEEKGLGSQDLMS